MFDYFYHQVFRKTVISFGTLFNNIKIKRESSDGVAEEIIEVPLAYGPTQKFLARIEQQANLNKPVQMSLPRMSFEFTGISYDTGRKLAGTQHFTTTLKSDKTNIKKVYFPVPYNMDFELSIMTLLNDDALQIVEQILPYFQPNYTLTIDLVDTIGEKRDVPITLESVNFEDNYEGDFTTRRVLLYTLKFTAKTYLFGPVKDSSKDVIRSVSVGLSGGDTSGAGGRNLIYKKPVATKNYTGIVKTILKLDTLPDSTILNVEDGSQLTEDSYITIDDETIYIRSINGNDITVTRGSYNTVAAEHVGGSSIYGIDESDNNLISAGDDFGFSG
jgi:hypothetical protein